jgi:molybdate-binding protein/DNA-binding transcriptional regulator YhcF (GntR family)
MKKAETFLYQEIAESLRRRIASGDLQPGDRLPPVREMAQNWSCTPGTVGRAYAQLSQEGLVAGHRGGGTRVAPHALQSEHPTWHWASLVNQAEQFLLAAIRGGHTPIQAEAALSAAISRWRDLGRKGTPQSPASPHAVERLRFVGSHDLTIELVSRMLSEEDSQAQFSIEYVGSLGGLIALARNEAEIAGTHLWDEATDTYNLPFARRLLPGRRAVLVTLAHRSMGLIIPPGNPQQLRMLGDLAHPDVRLVNRQSGSGTRVWLDAQFKALDISPESVPGYEQEEATHLTVARAVDQGKATVGLGIHAAASAYGLDFIPLTQEQYDLVFPEQVWNTPVTQTMIAIIRSPRFKEAVAALGGYDTTQTGQETWMP